MIFDLSERDVVLPGQAGQFAGCPHQVQAGYPAGGHCHGGDRDEFALLVDGEPRRPVDGDAVDHVAWLFLGQDAEQEARAPVRAADRAVGGGGPGAPLPAPRSITSPGCSLARTPSRKRATRSAPRTGLRADVTRPPPSLTRTTSGSSTRISAARSPEAAAEANTSTTRRCSAASVDSQGDCPRTCRLAREASCLTAAGVRPTMAATSSNLTPNRSCSTNAVRSAGDRVSITTRIA